MKTKELRDLLVPRDEQLEIGGEVIAILRNEKTGLYRVHKTRNVITDAGDIYYAQKAVDETPTNDFDVLELGTAGTPGKSADRDDFTPIASTEKASTASYPQTNDGDSDNTGADPDVVTWQFAYSAGDFDDEAITHGWITNATPGSEEPLLTGFAFTGGSFEKTDSDTLKVIVNHTFTGV